LLYERTTQQGAPETSISEEQTTKSVQTITLSGETKEITEHTLTIATDKGILNILIKEGTKITTVIPSEGGGMN
jgi:hypothetical protein